MSSSKTGDPNLVVLPKREGQSQASDDTALLTQIFREFEGAISRAKNLEEALKQSQTTLLRAQSEFANRFRSKTESEIEQIRSLEGSLRAARQEIQSLGEAHAARTREMEEKLKASQKRSEKLSVQLKNGAAQWNALVNRVKAQNEQMKRYSQEAEQARARIPSLAQEGQLEKNRRMETEKTLSAVREEVSSLHEKQQQLQADLLNAKKNVSTLEADLRRYKTAWLQASHAVKERDQRLKQLADELHKSRDQLNAANAKLNRPPREQPLAPPSPIAYEKIAQERAAETLAAIEERKIRLRKDILETEARLTQEAATPPPKLNRVPPRPGKVSVPDKKATPGPLRPLPDRV